MRKVNYNRFINSFSGARKESPIRETTTIALSHPDVLSLAAGMPNPVMFPFTSAQITTYDGALLNFSGQDMKQALQYTVSQGYSGLIKWVKELHKTYHKPPSFGQNPEEGGFDACITNGSQDGLSKLFEMLSNPGDTILLDDPCYAGTLSMLRPYGYNLVPVETDEHGMRSESLSDVMQRWKPEDALNPQSDIPKLIYTIPSGSNPTGVTATLDRKKEIYEVARKYDMLIIEDDPYFFLQFNEFVPSYQSIDVDGRVLRSDSMSKVMSAGLRIGWVSGAAPFIKRLVLHQQTTVIHSSTFGQTMVAALLDQWGLDGFKSHIEKVQKFYELQRDAMVRCLDKHLKDLAEWNVPTSGMFMWIKLKGIEDTTALIKKRALERKVLLLPGSVFSVEENKPSSYCRAAYSFASEEVMDEALSRLADLIRDELRAN